MNYFTSNTNEMKRKVVNFSKIMSNGLKKPDRKFIGDIMYGLSAGKDIKISNIARELHESIKLDNTIERLCLHLDSFSNDEIVNDNYYKYVRTIIPEYPVSIFDDSDITKEYGRMFEDLDIIKDASAIKETYKPGYHMCNAVVLTKNTKQPLPIYSKVYSSKSDTFESSNSETYKSIDAVRNCLKTKSLMVFDRGYDDSKLFDYVLKGGDDFLVRLKENRNFIFKNNKKRKLEDVYNSRKGKIKMHLIFEGEEKDVYISYTKAILPSDKRQYTLIFVYGLSDKEKFMLITNKDIKEAHDAIKLVRLYLYRWRIETFHRSIKTEYNYEDLRVRSLKAINNLTHIFIMLIGLIIRLIEEMDNKLLSIKIIYESKSLREKVGVWITQFAVGIYNMLHRSQCGIRSFFKSKDKEDTIGLQLSLQL